MSQTSCEYTNYWNEQDTECFVLVITSMYVILMHERFYMYDRGFALAIALYIEP